MVNAKVSANTTLDAPLGHIPVHMREGAALLLHSRPAYTIAETRDGAYALLSGFRGQSIIACAKKLRWRNNRT